MKNLNVDPSRNERFMEVVKMLDVSDEELSGIGIGKDLKSKIKTKRQNVSMDKLTTFCEKYEDASVDYILFGRGEPLRKAAKHGAKEVRKTVVQTSRRTAPFYMNLPVSAGQIIQYPDNLYGDASGSIDLPILRGAEFFFPVIGMSMLPTIEEGEVIGVKHIDTMETVNPDRIYMIITRDNERMIKRILSYDAESGLVTLGSDNQNYPHITITMDMIVDVYKVTCHMKLETL